jgi:hypothetical protein
VNFGVRRDLQEAASLTGRDVFQRPDRHEVAPRISDKGVRSDDAGPREKAPIGRPKIVLGDESEDEWFGHGEYARLRYYSQSL